MGKHIYKPAKDMLLVQVGERIQRYRLVKNNCTQEQLAESIDSNSSYISRVENGQAAGLTIKMAGSVADALGIPITELFDTDDGPSSSHSDKRVKKLLAKAVALSEHDRAFALDMFEAILDRVSKSATR